MRITKNPSYYTWLPAFVRNFAGWLFTPPRIYAVAVVLLLAVGGYWASSNFLIVPRGAAPSAAASTSSYKPTLLSPVGDAYQNALHKCDYTRGINWDEEAGACNDKLISNWNKRVEACRRIGLTPDGFDGTGCR